MLEDARTERYAMSKAVKAMIAGDLRERLGGFDGACVVDLSGMKVVEQQQLRRMLREKSARLSVVKNSLTRRALVDCPLEPLAATLEGPCALVTSTDSLIDAAKTLVEAADEFTQLTLKRAMIEGEAELLTVEEVARLKSRVELLGEVAMLVTSPARTLAGCLSSPQSKIAGCLKALIDRAA